MIHKIVEEMMECMDKYDMPIKDKFELLYCSTKIEHSYGRPEAMTNLNAHLDRHYKLRPNIEENVNTEQR